MLDTAVTTPPPIAMPATMTLAPTAAMTLAPTAAMAPVTLTAPTAAMDVTPMVSSTVTALAAIAANAAVPHLDPLPILPSLAPKMLLNILPIRPEINDLVTKIRMRGTVKTVALVYKSIDHNCLQLVITPNKLSKSLPYNLRELLLLTKILDIDAAGLRQGYTMAAALDIQYKLKKFTDTQTTY